MNQAQKEHNEILVGDIEQMLSVKDSLEEQIEAMQTKITELRGSECYHRGRLNQLNSCLDRARKAHELFRKSCDGKSDG